MYLQFYQLRTNPFHSTPDPACFFPSTLHATLLELLHASIDKGESLVVLSGEAGTGKTLLLRTFLTQVNQQKTCAIYLGQTSHLTFNALLCQVLQTFGVKIESRDTATLLSQVRSELIKERILRRTVLLILDDAHNLPQGTLRQLPALVYLEQPAEQLLQIILAGHQTLEDASQMYLGSLSVSSCFALAPLPLHESIAYLRYRLQQVALSDAAIFTDEALETLALRSHGIPGTLHQLAHRALVAGCIAQRKPLTEVDVRQILGRTPEPGVASRQPWRAFCRILLLLGGSIVMLGLLLLAKLPDSGIFPDMPPQAVRKSSEPSQEAPPAPVRHRENQEAMPGGDKAAVEGDLWQNPFAQAPATPALATPQPNLFVTTPAAPQDTAELSALERQSGDLKAASSKPTGDAMPRRVAPEFPLERVVQPGDTLWSLAMEIYGSATPTILARIQAANPRLRKIEHILAGTVLHFPDPKALPPPPSPVVVKTARPVQTAQSVQTVAVLVATKSESPRKRSFFGFLRKVFQNHNQDAAPETTDTTPFRDAPIDRPSQ